MVSGLTVLLVLTSDARIGISIRSICAGEDSLEISTSVNTRISRPRVFLHNFERASHFFVHFFAVFARIRREIA